MRNPRTGSVNSSMPTVLTDSHRAHAAEFDPSRGALQPCVLGRGLNVPARVRR
jgi:hypothetical protein